MNFILELNFQFLVVGIFSFFLVSKVILVLLSLFLLGNLDVYKQDI